MYPEDRVLVGVMPDPRDFDLARREHWYRIPLKQASDGIHAEYIAFYFTNKFGPDLRWAIHCYARRTGHELVRRVDLLPGQPDHPRAQEKYYKIQLGEMREKTPPVTSLRWRRITFIQTTWDRFVAAREINDLFRSDDQFVERLYKTLRQRGIYVERAVSVKADGAEYTVDLIIPCKKGSVMLAAGEDRPANALLVTEDLPQNMGAVQDALDRQGGPLMVDLPL